MRVSRPLPFMAVASMKSTSPPVAVQARPVAMPTASFLRISSGRHLGAPRYFVSEVGVIRTVAASPSATLRATLREMAAISRSRFLQARLARVAVDDRAQGLVGEDAGARA